jgi:tetratricopeptide (TPR) repeat protein
MASGKADDPGQSRRLKSWKEIAAYFGTDERTVKRWEVKRGLPVRRIPGGARPTVYADSAELEAWLAGRGAPAPEPAAEPSLRNRRRLALGAASAIAAAGLVALLAWPSASDPREPLPEAAEHYLAGVYQWDRRTPESLGRARDHFAAAIAVDPDYAAAHAGLASTWLLLREYSSVPDAEAYSRAEASARRSLALDGRVAEAHAALGFALFYGRRDFAGARAEFERAIALDPGSARAHHWYATALLHLGEFDRALREIEAAQRLDPRSRAILADKGLILFYSGRRAEAIASLTDIARDEPDFQSPHSYLAQIHLSGGNRQGWLESTLQAARLRGDDERIALLDAARKALERGGERAMLTALLEGQRRLHAEGREPFVALAATEAMLGDRPAALRLIEQSLERREPAILGLRVDPAFRTLHGDPAFERLIRRVGH